MDMTFFGYIAAGLLGLTFGSFSGATVWRLRARQIVEDKAEGEDYDKAELKRLIPLTKSKLKDDRSRCLSCGHELKWYDLLPLVSWISMKGKCRYCKKPIGFFEPLIELGCALLFVSFYHYWVVAFGLAMPVQLLVWGVALVLITILFAYDAKWFILPDVIVFPLIALAVVLATAKVIGSPDKLETLIGIVSSLAILAGLYFILWLVSKGAWVGFGDVKLNIALGLLLADWQLAFLTVFLANLIGTLIVIPAMATKRLGRKSHIPFGPMLILGFFISLYFGHDLIDWYVGFATTLML